MTLVIKYIKLPFQFDAKKLQYELGLLKQKWIAHLNKADYTGDWGALPLRSKDGNKDNIIPHNDISDNFCDTELMSQCPYIKEAIDTLPGDKKAIRLMNLKPGAVIKEHCDRDLCYEKGEARIHIPITTNKNVVFMHDHEQMTLEEGECWYLNFNLPHSLANNGGTDRVHLVIDCIVNDEMNVLFEQDYPGIVKKIVEKEQYTPYEKQLIIERLREMGTETALELIKKLENTTAITGT